MQWNPVISIRSHGTWVDEHWRSEKTSLLDVVSNFGMLHFMIGLDTHEFTFLFNMSKNLLMKEHPKTPLINNRALESNGKLHLSIILISFFTIMRCQHMNSFRFLEGLIWFKHSHLCHVMNRCELFMLKVSCEDFLQNPCSRATN